jgi:hypothetical protein
MRRHLSYANVCASLALLLVAGGLTATASGAFHEAASAQTIKACYAKKGSKKGLLRVAPKCKKSEVAVSWNQAGPAGANGANGSNGATGATGPAGGTTAASSSSVPSGGIVFFEGSSCPAGWSEYTKGRGRYLVGLGASGNPGAEVGTALDDQENRATGRHTHDVNDPGHAHAIGYDTDRLENLGNIIGGTRLFGTVSATEMSDPAFTGITIQPAGAVPGTNAPYVQLLACIKD